MAFLSAVYHHLSSLGGDDEKRGSYLVIQEESISNVSQSLSQQIFSLETVLKAGIRSNCAVHLTSCMSSMEQGVQYTQELLEEIAIFSSLQSALDQSLSESQEISQERSPIDLQKREDPQSEEEKSEIPELEFGKINLKKIDSDDEEKQPEKQEDVSDSETLQMNVAELQQEFYALRKNVDELMIQATEVDTKEEGNDIVQKLMVVREQCRTKVEIAEQNEDVSPVVEQFRVLSREIADSCERIRARKYDSRSGEAVDPVARVERQLFDLVQKVHDLPASDVSGAIALKGAMKKIKELLRNMRHHEKFTKAQHARVEDLQENLSDLQHEFGKKFSLPNQKRDLAKQTVLEMQVKQAQKHHQAIEEDMFDL
eukprot:CAMPEP_0117076534 /NCGR_PEP_ID=MMETSP0472-20121206/53949_1 /TAXON_ID=693140 ORGANISM="Tiarina fusus, Strain LIS" /NCGR_SAMPLE_ID=MMETSP0472 /ASSEMBLY_ACC=CAM_ASM_000603 /LENGTH=369 /DNA_ID=CAMNT_0004802469 /DNA_START=541 /DNA_END=1650 /DNA_ORIENTATION=+